VAVAHQRIDTEKHDRERAIDALKTDVNRGFDRLDRALNEQTRTVLEALGRRDHP
jgi:hypothetical protein